MPEEEVILKQESGVKAHESDSPPTMGLRAGAFAEVGTLILTNRRLAYVSKGGSSRAAAWVFGGALVAGAIEKKVSKAELDDLTNSKGSYSIPFQDITLVEAGRKMGQSYIHVDNHSAGLKPTHSYVLENKESNNEVWAHAINSAIAATRVSQTAPASRPNQASPSSSPTQTIKPTSLFCSSCGAAVTPQAKFCGSCGTPLSQPASAIPPPPPPAAATPTCPYCNGTLRYIQQYQRWYCDKEQRYL